jgi:glycosyltransferase involved in cell wall biosynthesis
MNVLLLPADTFGCGYYRMRMPAHYAESDTTINDRLALRGDRVLLPAGVDVVVFQRTLQSRMPGFIRDIQRQGVAVVVELDDDMAALDAHHANFREVHPRWSPDANFQHLKRCCAEADLVTVTTPALAERYAAHGRYAILPNYIESALLNYTPEKRWGIGWSGYVPTHPNDPQVMGNAAAELERDGHTWRVIGKGAGAAEAFGVTRVEATEWIPLADYYHQVASLEAGVVPLTDSAFNRAKSWLKGLEYAALGVPFVASPTPEYIRLQNDAGAGLLADKPKRWRGLLRKLMDDESMRWELAGHAREQVGARLTIEGNAWRWDEAWARAVTHRHARAANPAHKAVPA